MLMRSPLLLSLIIGVASSALTVFVPNSPLLAAETTTPNQRTLNQLQPVSRQVALTLERTACFGFCPITSSLFMAIVRWFIRVRGL